jgi:hypothetical protein
MVFTRQFSDREANLKVLAYRDMLSLGAYARGKLEGTDVARMHMSLPSIKDQSYYRVHIEEGKVRVLYFNYDKVDDQIEGEYDDIHDLPEWVQKQVAVLSMLSYNPPTPNIEGVGRRITKNTFWVEKPDS